MKEKLKNIFKKINTPIAIGIVLPITAIVVVAFVLITAEDANSPTDGNIIYEASGDDFSDISSETESSSEDLSTVETSSEETSDTTTAESKYTTLIEYTTIPIEEIQTTNDNSYKDEVMGGGNNEYEDGVFDGVDEVPTVKVTTTGTQPTTEEATTKKPEPATTPTLTTEPTSTEDKTTEKITTDNTTTDDKTTVPNTEATTTEPTTTQAPTTEQTTTDSTTETSTTESSDEPTTEEPTTKPSSNVIKMPDDFILDVTYGCDVSRWQGDIDWAKAKAAGVDFVMIKLGGRSTGEDGAIYMDVKFEQNIKGALENGIKVGVYFFSQAITIHEAIEEASYCIDVLKDYDINYPVCFDFEQGTAANGRRTYLAMADGRLTKELLTEIACAFCNTLESAGYDSMIYASRSSWTSERWNGEFLNNNYRTWLAVWYKTSNYMVPTFGTGNTGGSNTFKSKAYKWLPNFNINNKTGKYVMWQYSDSGRIDGIPEPVDLDMCFYIPEEYEGYTSPLAITVKNPVINTTVGKSVNVMAGVTGTNTVLVDKTSTITYTITNTLGATVSEKDAVKSKGTYTITYMITDFTGCKRYATATLNVT